MHKIKAHSATVVQIGNWTLSRETVESECKKNWPAALTALDDFAASRGGKPHAGEFVLLTRGGFRTREDIKAKCEIDWPAALAAMDAFKQSEPERLFQEIHEWSTKTFDERVEGVLAHLCWEAEELKNDPRNLEEFADVQMLTWDGAAHAGFTYVQLLEAVRAKLEKNKLRKWNAPNQEGFCQHKGESQTEAPHPELPLTGGALNQPMGLGIPGVPGICAAAPDKPEEPQAKGPFDGAHWDPVSGFTPHLEQKLSYRTDNLRLVAERLINELSVLKGKAVEAQAFYELQGERLAKLENDMTFVRKEREKQREGK